MLRKHKIWRLYLRSASCDTKCCNISAFHACITESWHANTYNKLFSELFLTLIKIHHACRMIFEHKWHKTSRVYPKVLWQGSRNRKYALLKTWRKAGQVLNRALALRYITPVVCLEPRLTATFEHSLAGRDGLQLAGSKLKLFTHKSSPLRVMLAYGFFSWKLLLRNVRKYKTSRNPFY